MTSALDEAVMARLLQSVGGDPEFLAELIGDYVTDAPAQLESLRLTAASGDAVGARRAAHTLKGNARTFGAVQLASLCEETEAAAAAGHLDIVLARVEAIEQEWARVQTACLVFQKSCEA
ncbi:MAG TPA: Hpt domain-containing protein [Solirubrobacteraceae bacterium]|jgi:HPt (histidine-containing phosphotransfer) domain-containing protein|nr:Hpt domain-containing protein [Solirubrobacteraceae bacterium]